MALVRGWFAASADNAINVTEGYDAYGNRNAQSGTLNESFPASAATNQISGFGYDVAGRTTSGSWGAAGSRTIGWDPLGQLRSYSDGMTDRAQGLQLYPVTSFTVSEQAEVVGSGRAAPGRLQELTA